jgi:hypothetical protein
MKWTFDFKYLLATAVAVASLIFPVYLWQSDLKAHALSVRLISSSKLQPFVGSKVYDVKMTVNGVELVNPFFSVYELVNSGSKPILNSDFESPIVFAGNSDLAFVSARVDLTEPKDIPVKVTLEQTKVSIAPFLSNPSDKVFLSIITSGPDPDISIKARIAGIREIEVLDSSIHKGSLGKLVIQFIFCVIFLTAYFLHALNSPSRIIGLHNRRLTLVSMFGCAVAGALTMKRFTEELGLIKGGVGSHENWIIGCLFLALSFGIAFVIRRYIWHNADSNKDQADPRINY